MTPFFNYSHIFTLNQGNFFQEFTSYRYKSIVSIYDKRKSKYEAKRKHEKRY